MIWLFCLIILIRKNKKKKNKKSYIFIFVLFGNPINICIDFENNIYISETSNKRIQKLISKLIFKFYWNEKLLKYPQGLIVNKYSKLFVCDSSINQLKFLIHKWKFWKRKKNKSNIKFENPNSINLNSNEEIQFWL